MRLFDTHCHFETSDRATIAAQLERAKASGVERILAVGGSPALDAAAALAAEIAAADPSRYPSVAFAAGCDRDQCGTADPDRLPDPPAGAVAVGEIGLDYHYSPETREAQLRLFAAQLEQARAHGLPVIVHTREADDDTLALLREIPSRGVIHCFTGTPGFARRLVDLGFFISISGIVTFRSADNVRVSALALPDDRMLIETDAPYLAPVPMRGSPNESSYIVHTCRFLAELRRTDAETLAELTFANGERMLRGCDFKSLKK